MVRTRSQSAISNHEAMVALSKSNPPTFDGSDVTKLEEWINKMNILLCRCHVKEEIRGDFASYYLEGEAFFWWASQYDVPSDGSWAELCQTLRDYFNPHAVEQRRRRAEYEGRRRVWDRLPGEGDQDYVLRFNENIVQVAPEDVDDMELIDLFRVGLSEDLRAAMEYPPVLPDISRSMSTILYVIRYFGPTAGLDNPAVPPPEVDEGAAPLEDESEEEEDPSEDEADDGN